VPFGGCAWLARKRRSSRGARSNRRMIAPHLIESCRFNKDKALGFLRFVVSYHFDGVGDEVLSGQPLLDVFNSDPLGKVAKKYGKAH
jgi:hypothetical protein